MKRNLTQFSQFLFSVCCLMVLATGVRAQLPVCINNGGFIYIESAPSIRNFDPTLPLGPTNPVLNTIAMPGGSSGLAVSANLNGVGPSPTFYTTIGGNYWYYDGTTWVNTGHSTGNSAAVNPGGGGGYIYNIVGGTGQIYRYDGTGPATLIVTITDFQGGGPYDLQVDCSGNFYVFKGTSSGSGQWMRKYSPTGVLLQSWTVSGVANVGAGPGFAIVGTTVYYFNNSNYYVGTIGPTSVTFVPGTAPAVTGGDWGSCEIGGINNVKASIDTGYYCGSGPGIAVSATGVGTLHWTVLSGSASITSSGSNATIIPTSTVASIEVRSDSVSICGSGNRDTFTVVRPIINLDAGLADTIFGCAVYVDTLQGSFNGLPAFTNFNLNWTPGGSVVSGGNTLSPIVSPTGDTRYILSVSTPANQGSCLWTDTVDRWTKDVSVTADYDFNIGYGCTEDTVYFTNLSTSSVPLKWRWTMAPTVVDTATNPVHIYEVQDIYNVKLFAYNANCRDSVTKAIDINHPLNAMLVTDKDSICQGEQIAFTNTSITTTKFGISPSYFWDFGDGSSSAAESPVHTYSNYGTYNVQMRVTDFVPCTDTAFYTIVVDSIPYAQFSVSDSILCSGTGIRFVADYLPIGSTGIRWDFGDGTALEDLNPLTHAYDTSGTYTVKLYASYRLCQDQDFSRNIEIRDHPFINIGPDTAICPGGPGVALFDRNPPTPGATYEWNTGQTTPLIAANAVGTFWATISLNGCSTTDSVEVRKDCYLDVPNAFTPNGDGSNDYFLPRELLSRSLAKFNMVIYNRWGQTIFETNSLNGRGWDGRFNGDDQPGGVYIYRINATFENNVQQNWTGNVTLLR